MSAKLNTKDPLVKKKVLIDEVSYFFGVANVMFSSWLIGAFPWAYWVHHLFKLIVYMSYRVYNFSERKLQFWLFDYCYVINYWIVLYYVLSLAGVCPWPETVFRVAFTSVVGPLALSVAAFRNSLVFHSSDQLIILAIHFSPNVAIWGMRWWPKELDQSFPGIFNIGCGSDPPQQFSLFFSKEECPATFSQLYGWPIFIYALWAITYYLFFFVFAKGILKRGGYYTMFEDMSKNTAVKAVLNLGGSWGQELKYMCAHGTLCCVSLLIGPLLWHSFILHTIYLGVIVAFAVFNGGTFYFQVFAKNYYASLINVIPHDHDRDPGADADGVDDVDGADGADGANGNVAEGSGEASGMMGAVEMMEGGPTKGDDGL